jgi:DNA-binding NarL/FixJ family response regulator
MTEWKITGEERTGAEALKWAGELMADMIRLDFSMPNKNGIEAASVLKKVFSHANIITMFDIVMGSRLSSAAGADLAIPKSEWVNTWLISLII